MARCSKDDDAGAMGRAGFVLIRRSGARQPAMCSDPLGAKGRPF